MKQSELPKRLYFLLPVWGQVYADFFVNFSLPSQLSDKNIPSIKIPITYIIFSDRLALFDIIFSASYKKLKEIADVKIKIISTMGENHVLMSKCYKKGIKIANKQNCPCVFITPDVVFSDGTFKNLEKIIRSGKRVVYLSGIRLEKEKGRMFLKEYYRSNNTMIQIESREFVKKALSNLHKWGTASLVEEGNKDWLPSNFYWKIAEEGILAFCFHLHPLFVWPRRKKNFFSGTIDADYPLKVCPNIDDSYVIQDSDEGFMGEFSTKKRAAPSALIKGWMPDLIKWMKFTTNKKHRLLVRVPTYIHSGKRKHILWEKKEIEAKKYVDNILSLYKKDQYKFDLNTLKWLAATIPFLRKGKRKIESIFKLS